MLGMVKLVLGCALPVALALVHGYTGDGLTCGPTPKASVKRPSSQAEVYRRIPKEPGILINISRALFPATQDVTLLGDRAARRNVRTHCRPATARLRSAPP